MKNQIVFYLLKLGVRPHYTGFNYLVTALEIALASETRVPVLEIYKLVAQEHGVTPNRVERCIRTAIQMYCGKTDQAEQKYKNSEFIYLCVMNMRMMLDLKSSS